ncbi:MAG: Mannosylglycerate hydrolase [Chloroflexi bacterium ADurb.Bin325]|nr:MAG: Mannosylglycerate hydrolase [Chloroflexi bacterium ADurb.Bin325]
MALNPEWRDRILHWRRVLNDLCYRPLGEVELSGFITTDHLRPEQAAAGPFQPMPAGASWGAHWEYGWFRGAFSLPPAAAGERIVLHLQTGGEGIVWINGQMAGAVDRQHKYITLQAEAEPAAHFEILAESYAGHGFISVGEGPIAHGRTWLPETPAQQATLGASTYGIWDETVFQLWMDVDTLWELREMLDPTSLRADEIDAALKEMTLLVDVEAPRAELLAGALAARDRLRPVLDATNGTSAPLLWGFGHAHIDVAWLWPIQETQRKTARTFSNQLALMEEYPEYIFLQSEAQLYAYLKHDYPDLYERVKERIRSGHVIAEGAAWVEPDTNVPSGESLIRQFIHGKRFFKDEFGVDCQIFWEPDVFGYSAALPQIMRGCGLKYFGTQKIMWEYNAADPFPYNQFVWEGVDGTEVWAHIFHGYSYETSPKTLIETWRDRRQKADTATLMLPFGYGDGGGGVTREQLEYLRRSRDLQGVPRTIIASPLAFFEDMERRGEPKARYVGELYFQAHRGTFTSQAQTKRLNRRAELALRDAELWSVAAHALKGYTIPLPELDHAWKLVLLNQFHDILPGSSIARVYDEAERDLAEVVATGQEITAAATSQLASGDGALTVFNSLSFPRTVLAELPVSGGRATDAQGAALPVQSRDGRTLVEVTTPACGWTTINVAAGDAAPATDGALRAALTGDGAVLENELIRATFDAAGELVSLWDKAEAREWMAAPGNAFLMYKDVPRMWDAWDIDSNYVDQPVELSREATLAVAAEGPLLAALRVTRTLHNSPVVQEIRLRRGSRRLDFVTSVEWQEKHKLLKVAFPVTIHADEAIHEIQYAHVRRPNHRSRHYDADRFEVPQQRWTALAEEGRGAAVLNDSKYGVDVLGNAIRLTLLKSAMAPDPHADEGMQEFTYSLYVWNGSFYESEVIREAADLNTPATVAAGAAAEAVRSLFTLDAANIFLDTVKPAEDGSGDVVLRLYEAKRTATRCTLATTLPFARASQTNMLEEHQADLAFEDGRLALDFRPFEVKTLRLGR